MTNKKIKVEVFSAQKYKDLEVQINYWLKNKQPEDIKKYTLFNFFSRRTSYYV